MPAKRGPAARQSQIVYGIISITPESFGFEHDNCLDMLNDIARDIGLLKGQMCAYSTDDEESLSSNIFMVFRTRWRHNERSWFSLDTSIDYDAGTSTIVRDRKTHAAVLGLKVTSAPQDELQVMVPPSAMEKIQMRTSWKSVKHYVNELIYALLAQLAAVFQDRPDEEQDKQAFAVAGDDRWIPADLRTLIRNAELVAQKR